MKRSVPMSLALAGGLLLAGCAASDSQESAADAASAPAASASAMQDESMSAESEAPNDAATEGSWIDQAAFEADPASFHAAGEVVLFFSATWCPTCQASIKALDRDGVPAGLTVVQVDYDTQTDLRQQHGVTVQHTYVQVDESGNTVTKWTGSITGEQIAEQTV